MTRQKGMSLVEIMIAMALAGIVSAFILMITRTQLIAYEQNDQVTRMQQNERAGTSFVENLLRRACGGIAYGRVGINLPGVTQEVVNCLTIYDGAKLQGNGFANDTPTSKADAVEIIYGTSPFTSVTSVPNVTSTPSVNVANATGFKKDDLVLLTDMNQAVLMKLAADPVIISGTQATLSFGSLTGPVKLPDNSLVVAYDSLTAAKITTVMKAVVQSIYLENGAMSSVATDQTSYKNMLMLDADGRLSTAGLVQPLVDNVIDFQLALGADDDQSGAPATSEWRGDGIGELPLAVAQWNRDLTDLRPRWLRVSMVYQTANKYVGKSVTVPQLMGTTGFENRTTYPTVTGGTPRYRPVRITVAPRVWNLVN